MPLAVAQWLLLLALTQRIVHNGWLFAQDGGSTFLYSAAWSLAHGRLPPALVGYGWPLVTAPLAGIAGVDFLDALPTLVVIQTTVLLPLALFALYGVASRIGGRRFAYLAAAVWVFLPYAVHPLFVSGYHPLYVQQLLPEGLGLTGLVAFPSMVCVLVAAYFALTSIETADRSHALLAGLLAGFAIAMEPANALFLAAPLAGYAVTRRWAPAGAFAIALLPALATVAIWQYRGLGHVPHIHAAVDAHGLELLRDGFRSGFYSDRLVELPFLAGVIALARRSWVNSVFVSAWLLPYLLVRGSSAGATFSSGSWFGDLMPAFPAFVLAISALPLLVPRLGEHLADAPRMRGLPPVDRRDPRVVAAALALAALPLVVVVALPTQRTGTLVAYGADNALVPVSRSLQATGDGQPGAGVVTWLPTTAAGAKPFYVVLRSPSDGSGGLSCDRGGGAPRCALTMQRLGSTREVQYLDVAPPVPPGRWTYRVGVAANFHDDSSGGGLMLLSPPVEVTVP